MSIPLISDIVPQNNGAFPTHSDIYGKGGFQVRTDITDRDNIPTLNRKIGMLVFVQSTGLFYSLSGGITNSHWIISTFNAAPTFEVVFSGRGIIQDGYAEVSQFFIEPRFSATYNLIPDAAVLTDDDGNPAKDVISSPEFFNSDGYFQKNTFGGEVNFTLSSSSDSLNSVETFKVIWGQRNYFGVGLPGSTGQAFIKGMNSFVSNSAAGLFAVNAGTDQKIYYACRAAYGTPTFVVNGFEGGFFLVSNSISLSNPYGFIENYALFESDNINLSITSVEVL